jgi:hypothetical protein
LKSGRSMLVAIELPVVAPVEARRLLDCASRGHARGGRVRRR